MPLKRLGKPPYLTVAEVNNNDVVEIVDAPYIVEAEKTRWGRERARVVVKLANGGERTWSLNNTTYNRLLDAFGNEGDLWIGKRVRIKLKEENVSGVNRQVMYGQPYTEPQQQLNTPDKEFVARFSKLAPDQKKAFLEALKEETQ